MSVATTKNVGDFVREGLQRAYEVVHPGFGHGDAVDVLRDPDLLADEAASTQLPEDLLHDSGPSEYEQAREGEWDEFDGGRAELAPRGSQYGADEHFRATWLDFANYVKHEARFFGAGGTEDARRELLEEFDGILNQLTCDLEAGTVYWRARLAGEERPTSPSDKARQMGPPPPEMASNNRMSPTGISYAYLASDPRTCLAEIRPDIGARVWLAKFEARRAVSVVDTVDGRLREPVSMFSDAHDPADLWAQRFLGEFRMRLAEPWRSDATELEYAPTQVLSEYVRFHGPAGMKYPSSQQPDGHNLVIFRNAAGVSRGFASAEASGDVFSDLFRLTEFEEVSPTSTNYDWGPFSD